MRCHSSIRKTKNLQWTCIQRCGACCKLSPLERSEALEVLNPEQRKLYEEMVLSNGWCRYYDTNLRRCSIYSERPDFCKVENLWKLFKIKKEDSNLFSIKCCREQIRSLYGGKSTIMRKFEKAIKNKGN